jgi:hypothetical protein
MKEVVNRRRKRWRIEANTNLCGVAVTKTEDIFILFQSEKEESF